MGKVLKQVPHILASQGSEKQACELTVLWDQQEATDCIPAPTHLLSLGDGFPAPFPRGPIWGAQWQQL